MKGDKILLNKLDELIKQVKLNNAILAASNAAENDLFSFAYKFDKNNKLIILGVEKSGQLINIQAVLLELKEDIKFAAEQKRYYSVNEVCKILGISTSTLYNWIKLDSL